LKQLEFGATTDHLNIPLPGKKQAKAAVPGFKIFVYSLVLRKVCVLDETALGNM